MSSKADYTLIILELYAVYFFFFFFLSALLIEDKVVFSQVAATPFVATAILALYHRVITSNHSM